MEIAAVDMSTCDETSVKSIVDREKTTKRRRKKPARFDNNSSSDRDTDEDENTNNKNDKSTVSIYSFIKLLKNVLVSKYHFVLFSCHR